MHNGDDGENDVGNDGGGRKGAGEGLENYKPCPFNAQGSWCVTHCMGPALSLRRRGWEVEVVKHLPNVKKFGEISLDKVKSL